MTSGQPIAIPGCGNFTSTTSSITYQWMLAPNSQIPDGHQAVSLPNGSLFLQNPNTNNNERTYQCITSGSPIETLGQSVYVLITVTAQGKCMPFRLRLHVVVIFTTCITLLASKRNDRHHALSSTDPHRATPIACSQPGRHRYLSVRIGRRKVWL